MNKKETRWMWYMKCFAAFLFTYLVFLFKFPHYILEANNQIFIPNGDPLVTIYDLIYHVRHDDSTLFTGMNYPEGEYIFMTDALGSFATVFRWIDTYLFDIDHILPGLIFSFIFALLGVCGMFLFMILRTMGLQTWLALALSPLITLLSPQMVRIIGHLSLSFPFVIPMVMLWCLRKFRFPTIEWRDAFFILVTFFFFMNNAYIGFIMCMFAGVTGFVLFLKSLKNTAHRKAAILMMTIPVAITLVVFILLKTNDPYDDRLAEQWGFFYYHTKFISLFAPKYSLAAEYFPTFNNSKKASIEWTNNLGIVPILLVLSYVIYEIGRRIKRSWKPLLSIDTMMSTFLWAAFLMFLFAANTTIFPIKDFIESRMDILLMFKASGRFSWPLYFVIGVFAAHILQGWIRKLQENKTAIFALSFPLLFLYGYETNRYLDTRFTGKDEENYLTAPQSDEVENILQTADINTDEYEAMILLPAFIGWNEKFKVGVFNFTEKGGLTVSAITGIPMINGRLSRNSTRKTLEGIQLASHPLIHTHVLPLLQGNKAILLIQGKNSNDRLTIGERALKALSTKVFETEKYEGYKVAREDIYKYREDITRIAEQKYLAKRDSVPTHILRLHYDESNSPRSLFGTGAFISEEGKQKLVDTTLHFERADTLRFTAWSEVTYEKYGMPEYIITAKGPEKYYHRNVLSSRTQREIYKNWVRSEAIIPVAKGENRIEVVLKGNQPFLIDELQLSYARDTVFQKLEGRSFLMNNIPVVID